MIKPCLRDLINDHKPTEDLNNEDNNNNKNINNNNNNNNNNNVVPSNLVRKSAR